MTNSDWYAEVEGKSSDLPSSSDLFDGELFGDELIDIYNVAVEGTHTDETHENEIPTLPDHEAPAGGDVSNKDTPEKEMHPGAQVAATAAAIDDGLGAFRPATSFNDLTTLLPSSSKAKDGKDQTAAEDEKKSGQKKKTGPATKKGSAAGVKRKSSSSSTSNKTQKSSGDAVAVAKAKVPADAKAAAMKATKVGTPNPLNGKSVPAPPKSAPTTSSASSNRISSAKNKAASKVAKPDAAPSAAGGDATKHAATEADFKSVAQAAITSLIQSTKTGEVPTAKGGGKKVDISTKHIKALTGNNWVSACSGAGAAAVAAANVGSSAASISSADSQANNANKPNKRQNLTADQRAHQNRERNREHARNTRLRKKAYVEELKATLTELVAQRDKAELEKRQAEQREVEQREVRFRVMEEFLKLRGRNETSPSRWAAILDDGFSLTLPATDYQEILYGEPESGHDESVKLEQVLSSVTEVMAESNNFATFLQALGKGEEKSNGSVTVGFTYHCDRNNFFMDDSNAVLDWTANSEGAVKKGANSELSMRGSIRARFCPASNKLLSANIVYDTGAVHAQLPELTDVQSDAAARAASHQADAILDSLQMPHLDKSLGSSVAVVPQSGDSSDEGL